MKLSRNKISKLIKKKKHSRSKIHKKRDGHTVVFSKSKDYDKPITRKKGGWKGYHGRICKRTMKRVYRGGVNTNPNPQITPQKPSNPPTATTAAQSAPVTTATAQSESTPEKAEVCAVLPEDPQYKTWEQVEAALKNFELRCKYDLFNKVKYIRKIIDNLPDVEDNKNVREKLEKILSDDNMLKSKHWAKWISDFIPTTVSYEYYNECSINLKNITKDMDNVKSDTDAIKGISNFIQLYNDCYVGIRSSDIQTLWKDQTVSYLNDVLGKSLLQEEKYKDVKNFAGELRDALTSNRYDRGRVENLVKELGSKVKELDQDETTKVGDKSGKSSATPSASSTSSTPASPTASSSVAEGTCSTLPTQGKYEEILEEIRKFNLESGCGISKQSVQQFLENLQGKINSAPNVSKKDEPTAKIVEKEFNRLKKINEPNFSFGEWLKSFVLDIAPSTLSDDAKEKCKNDIDIVNVNFDTFEEFAKSVASMDTLFGTCYKPEKGEISRPVTVWKEKYIEIITRYNKLLETSEEFKNNTEKLSGITSILNELENSSNFKSVNSTQSDDIESILIKLKDAIKAYSAPSPTLPKEGTAGQTGSISANDLQTMQQKSAEALKSAQEHHAKVQDLVKANPLATLSADTYNFDECMSESKKSHEEDLSKLEAKLIKLKDVKEGDGDKYDRKQRIINEISNIKKYQSFVEPNPEYRKAQPKCKPFIDKSMTERKQWVKDMKDGLIIKNPSEKCAAFTASESKKVDGFAAKCAKQENQVVVNITQAPINDTHKRMNITVFAPNKSEVVLQDYAHSTYEQTMHNFEDLKMDGELDLSGLTNAASAAKDAVKKAASATITAATKAATTAASATKKAATKAKEVVSGTGTTPDAPATPSAPATPATPSAPATPAGPGIIGKIKNYLRKGQIKEMRENMSNLQDVSDQLSDDMTPNQVKQQENMVEEINSLIDKLTQKQPASVTQVGGDQNLVNDTIKKYNESKNKYDAQGETSSLEDRLKASAELTGDSLAMSKATLQHLKETNIAPASTIQDKLDAEKQHNIAINQHRDAAYKHNVNSLLNETVATGEFNKAKEASGNAPDDNEQLILGSEMSNAEGKLKNATENAKTVSDIQENAIKSLEQSNESLLGMHKIKHKQSKVALDKARTNLNNVKVTPDSTTKNIIEATKATKEFKNALSEHTKATEDINNTQLDICNSKPETETEECLKNYNEDKEKRADEVNKSKKDILDVANTKVSAMQVTKRQQDIKFLLDTYEIILKKLRKMYGGPGAKKGDIMVSQSVLDNMNALLVKMVTQQEIIVKALGKITPENEIFTNQSEEVSGFMFEAIKEYVERNVSVSETVKKGDMENINEQLKTYIKKIEKDVLSNDARNYTKDVISSARASNEPIKSVNNRVKVWREIIKYIRKDVLNLNPIEEMDILAQDLSNLLAKIKDTPLKDDDQTKIVEIIKEINQIIYKDTTLSKFWDAVWSVFESFALAQIDTNKENENKEKMKYFTSLSGDDKEPEDYKEKVEGFVSKLKDIKEKMEKLDLEDDSSGPQKIEITGTDATTINNILGKIKEQANKLSKNVNENTQKVIVVTLEKVKEIESNYNFKGSNNNQDLTNLFNDLSTNDKNKLFDSKTIPGEKSELDTYNVSIENIKAIWQKSLDAIYKIIKNKNNNPQEGGRKRHSRKSKKRKSKSKSKSKSSGIKLTRKSSKK